MARRKRRANRCYSVPRGLQQIRRPFDRLDLGSNLIILIIIIIIVGLILHVAYRPPWTGFKWARNSSTAINSTAKSHAVDLTSTAAATSQQSATSLVLLQLPATTFVYTSSEQSLSQRLTLQLDAPATIERQTSALLVLASTDLQRRLLEVRYR